MNNDRRVVITGIGIVSSVGNTRETFWHSLLEGRSGIRKINAFDASAMRSQIAGEIKDFDIHQYMEPREAKRLDRYCHYAIAAGDEALAHAGLEGENAFVSERAGVLVSSGIGGIDTLERQSEIISKRGPGRASPLLVPMMIADIASGVLSIRHEMRGPNFGIVSACASGAHSIGESFWIIKRGDADVMMSGGTEGCLCVLGLAGFNSMKALSTRNDDPEHASRPFDAERDGFVPTEGAGILILEEYEHAKARGAEILAELLGYGATGDAYHITAPGGGGAPRCINVALQHAGLNHDQVDYINAHGTSTLMNDKVETAAIKEVFGTHAEKLAISSTKSMTGHALGAAGGLECAATVLSLKNGIIPGTMNYENPDPECDLDYVPNEAREMDAKVGMNFNFGFGGHNAVLAFGRI